MESTGKQFGGSREGGTMGTLRGRKGKGRRRDKRRRREDR